MLDIASMFIHLKYSILLEHVCKCNSCYASVAMGRKLDPFTYATELCSGITKSTITHIVINKKEKSIALVQLKTHICYEEITPSTVAVMSCHKKRSPLKKIKFS